MEVDKDAGEKYKTLLNHVVLPRFLPQSRSEQLHSEELALMSFMAKNVTNNELLTQYLPPATVKMFNMINEAHTNLSPTIVSQQIRSLQPGDTFGMFVRRQNCGIMIHMPKIFHDDQSKRVIVATFPGNIHRKHIYQNDSDIKVTILWFVITIWSDILNNFTVQLSSSSAERAIFPNDMFGRFC